MESVLSEKMVDAIKLSLTNSNPFMKTNILIKRASIFIFITFGFTLVNYFTLKNIIKNQTELSENIKKIQTTMICNTYKRVINRDIHKNKVTRSTSTSNLLREDISKPTILDKNDSEYEILDDCYDVLPCNNLKKNIT
jgi:hypothetical protein